jgi:hypothetical protein
MLRHRTGGYRRTRSLIPRSTAARRHQSSRAAQPRQSPFAAAPPVSAKSGRFLQFHARRPCGASPRQSAHRAAEWGGDYSGWGGIAAETMIRQNRRSSQIRCRTAGALSQRPVLFSRTPRATFRGRMPKLYCTGRERHDEGWHVPDESAIVMRPERDSESDA